MKRLLNKETGAVEMRLGALRRHILERLPTNWTAHWALQAPPSAFHLLCHSPSSQAVHRVQKTALELA